MLRELTLNEMKIVSGGQAEKSIPPPGFTGQQWEWAWAQRDATVALQMDLSDALDVLAEFANDGNPSAINENPPSKHRTLS